MLQQKIVIKVTTCCDKCRSKVLKTAATASGVNSVALEGDDKEKLVVIGERVDAACLTKALRKKVNFAILERVEELKHQEKKPEKKPEDDNKPTPPCCQERPRCELVSVVYDTNPETCTIL
ncbi:heavy metal-associated isoprenylated plant protein 47-like isoform X1 [Hevea brasiliensis]|uniref:heavy metal-associated isoprenylated plant protein 47-like isoform X1 n=1 Tax=Hevea brasiliensis TaxID=3981 RepID=UPI0025E04022|nr:heavy metal-associated isoprenylated plant protein 47-like isoform X1 [Hevea brasiliensis]